MSKIGIGLDPRAGAAQGLAAGLYAQGNLLAAAAVARRRRGALATQIMGLATWWSDPRFGSGARVGAFVCDFMFPRYAENYFALAPGAAITCAHTGTVNVPRLDGALTAAGEGVLPRSNLGLLIEPAATNLYSVSEGASGIWISQINATVAASSTPGPNGATSFYALVTSTSNGGLRQSNLTVPADTLTRVVSAYVRKKSGGQVAQFQAAYVSGNQSFVQFNLTSGSVVLSSGMAAPPVDCGDCWRVSVKVLNTSKTTMYSQMMPVVGGTGSCEVGGLMCAIGAIPSSYVAGGQTRGAVTVTTAVDVDVTSGRVALSAVAAPSVDATSQVLWQRDDGTADNRFCIYRDTSRVLHFLIVQGGATQSDRTFGTISDGGAFTAEVAWKNGVASYRLNGGAPFLEFGVTLPTVTIDRLGSSSGGEQWGGLVKSYMSSPVSEMVLPTFGDSFNRADTPPGSLGDAPDGLPYDIRAPYTAGSHPADTHAQIVSKEYVADVAGAITYACRVSSQVVRHIAGAWRVIPNPAYDSGQAAGVATMCLLISGAASPSLLATDIGAHVTVSRAGGGLFVQTRRAVADGGNFITHATRTAAQVGVVADGRLLTCDVRIKPNDDMVVVVNGVSITVNVPGLYEYPGLIACWERYQTANPSELVKFVGCQSDLVAA